MTVGRPITAGRSRDRCVSNVVSNPISDAARAPSPLYRARGQRRPSAASGLPIRNDFGTLSRVDRFQHGESQFSAVQFQSLPTTTLRTSAHAKYMDRRHVTAFGYRCSQTHGHRPHAENDHFAIMRRWFPVTFKHHYTHAENWPRTALPQVWKRRTYCRDTRRIIRRRPGSSTIRPGHSHLQLSETIRTGIQLPVSTGCYRQPRQVQSLLHNNYPVTIEIGDKNMTVVKAQEHSYLDAVVSGVGAINTVSSGPDNGANNNLSCGFWKPMRHSTTEQAIQNFLSRMSTKIPKASDPDQVILGQGIGHLNIGGHGTDGQISTGCGQNGQIDYRRNIMATWNDTSWDANSVN